MGWARFVAGFSRHPKRIKCGPVSSWLWLCSVDHCAEYLTDGFVDAHSVSQLCPKIDRKALARAVQNLVDVGSWEEVPGGYMVHGYLEHNQSRAQVESERESSRLRYTTWKTRQLRGGADHGPDNGTPHAVTTPYPNAVTTPLQRRRNVSYGREVGREVGTKNLEEGLPKAEPVAHATGSDLDEHERKKREALKALDSLKAKYPSKRPPAEP